MPYSYIEEQKVNLFLNDDKTNAKRENRFKRDTNTPIRVHSLKKRSGSENRFAAPHHLMPKMVPSKLKRFNSWSLRRISDRELKQNNQEYQQRRVDLKKILAESNIKVDNLSMEYKKFLAITE